MSLQIGSSRPLPEAFFPGDDLPLDIDAASKNHSANEAVKTEDSPVLLQPKRGGSASTLVKVLFVSVAAIAGYAALQHHGLLAAILDVNPNPLNTSKVTSSNKTRSFPEEAYSDEANKIRQAIEKIQSLFANFTTAVDQGEFGIAAGLFEDNNLGILPEFATYTLSISGKVNSDNIVDLPDLLRVLPKTLSNGYNLEAYSLLFEAVKEKINTEKLQKEIGLIKEEYNHLNKKKNTVI